MLNYIEQVLSLQHSWNSANTPEMSERGEIVRVAMRDWIVERIPAAIEGLPDDLADLSVRGRDGTGLKSEVPWIRIYSDARSPKPTDGWYLVYLFDAFGDAVYLSLNQGTTKWDGGEFRPRPFAEIATRADWARNELAAEISQRSDLNAFISLPTRNSKLAAGYEFGNVVAIKYPAGQVPAQSQLEVDLAFMLKLTLELYEYSDVALSIPGDPSPEVLDALMLSALAAGNRRGGRKFRLSPLERKAIEERAVSVTTAHLEASGHTVLDVGATESYDLDATKGFSHLFVEVKGTVSTGVEVILTKNEVALHLEKHPNNMLAVVHGIQLDRSGKIPIATGGTLRVTSPWQLDVTDLTALTYSYVAPAPSY